MVEIFDDIRKLYQFKAPCEALTDYIEFFSETSLDTSRQLVTTEKYTIKLFPSYTPTIWINLGLPYTLKNGSNQFYINAGTDILLLRNAIVERTNFRSDNIFTVKFHPGGFEAVFGVQQNKIGGDIINVKSLLSSSLLLKFKRLDYFEDRMNLLQHYFLGLLNVKFADNYLYKKVKQAVSTYTLSAMTYSNIKLANEMFITDKTLYRYFKNLVGIAPKKYFSIIRARTALTSYVTHNATFSPYDYGFYDMSHFRKEVVIFTGQKLTAWGS